MEEITSHDGRDEEDEDEYEEVGGGSRLLGFMFGNVDNSGDLDVDYLDEDAKEHLSALADKLGPSLTDMDLIKSSPTTSNASEQDFDEKAEDAIDYEDIDEQYDGPEIQVATEEDHLLPRKEYFSSDAYLSSLNSKASIFDEEDYDEDEEIGRNGKINENIEKVESLSLAGGDLEVASAKTVSLDDDMPPAVILETEEVALEPAVFQEGELVPDEHVHPKSETALPVLCVEDGLVILRFSEIFGVHEPLKSADRRPRQKRPSSNEREKIYDITKIVEEDEEAFLRSANHDLSIMKKLTLAFLNGEEDSDQEISLVGVHKKDLCLGSLPMKDVMHDDASAFQRSLLSPKFYPLDHQDWEDGIIWGNSPQSSFDVSRNDSYSEHDTEDESEENLDSRILRGSFKSNETGGDFFTGAAQNAVLAHHKSLKRECHQQLFDSDLLSRRHSSYSEEMKTNNVHTAVSERAALQRFDRLSLKNNDLLSGSWLDHIIWDPDGSISRPKLILDLQDEKMQFEILDYKDHEYLSSRAAAMVVVRPSKASSGESSDVHNQGIPSSARFNISNDKYYSNRKISQQAKSHTKKRTTHGIKGLHSVPALRLQSMKPKLSNKDIANFHKPKAIWYPHANEIAAKAQGALTNGPIKVVLMTLAGKGVKLHVDAEETLSSVKLKTSKKLEFKMSEKVKVIYSGRELEDDKFLAFQGVRPNSVLHLVRTRIQIWPKAQRLPGENRPRRPPGAFKKKSELSVKDGHVFLMEYCEERPLLLGNVGMGARFCTYYQKHASNDQTGSALRNGNNGLGTVLTLDPSDRSPFLGDIGPGCSQSCLETNMYRSPIFPHKLPLTDYLLVRSAKGALSLRRIDRLFAVGQQEPLMEVLSPGSKNVQSYLVNRMLVYVYREFRANEKPGILPSVRADELAALFPGLTDAFMRKRLRHFADLKRGAWVKRIDFRIPSEEELRRMLAPENVCSYESMQAGLYRLKRLGISRLTNAMGLSSAMNQLPDEAITLAAASHIERELQITSWNLTSNFVACTNQDRENIERLEITGVGDPSGRGLGFSYVRVTPKAPITSAVVKKKAAASKGGSTVTGTDADLRRLSMDAAREVLVKFKVPEEQIDKLTRWHRIALVRKLSSEQAATGVKVEAMTLSKFARGQRMSYLQLQQQTREKCQEIWDRQVQSLSAANDDENESDSEANSDLDSFAGDLENLLDAEEFDEESGNVDAMVEKADVAKGLKMRRCHSFSQTEEEIEDAKAEAAFIRRLLDDDESEIEKKKKPSGIDVGRPQFGTETAGSAKKLGIAVRQLLSSSYPDGSHTSKELMIHQSGEVENSPADANSWKSKAKKGNAKNVITMGFVKKTYKTLKDGTKVHKEKKHADRRESFVCGACGQLGHMRTNKNCPRYGEDAETLEKDSRSRPSDGANRSQLKVLNTKIMSALPREVDEEAFEIPEKREIELLVKVPPLKFKCGSADKLSEKSLTASRTLDKLVTGSTNFETKQAGKNLIIPIKMKGENVQPDTTPKPTVRILPPQGMDREPPKKIVIKQPRFTTNKPAKDFDLAVDPESRKMKKIAELAPSFEKQRKLDIHLFMNDEIGVNHAFKRSLREEKGRNMPRLEEERTIRMIEERRNYEAAIRWEEVQHSKKKKKKKKKPDFSDDYLMDHRAYRTELKLPERDRISKRRNVIDTGLQEYAPSTKRRRGGEVVLSNILESIVDQLRDNVEISYLFLKPVTKKEAPDYFDVIKTPMDLSTIRGKVRNLGYRSREDFRHDVWQIAFNAHKYNDRRNPGIPPLADQLLELCDYIIHEKDEILTDAEAGVES